MIKAILFDLDGTLLPMDQDEFTRAYFKLLAKKAAPRGYDPAKLSDAIWHGTAAMVRNDGSCTNEETFWKDFAKIYGERVYEDKPIFDEFYATEFNQAKDFCGYNEKAAQAVRLCKELGFRVILATNPIFPEVATRNRVSWTGLSCEDFEFFTSYENSNYCKPNLDYYRAVLKQAGLEPADCLMVGNDVDEDMVAEKLGMDVFLIRDCMINKSNTDIHLYKYGGFDGLMDYVKGLVKVEPIEVPVFKLLEEPVPESAAQSIVTAMGMGFNIGNSLDAVAFRDPGVTGLDTETAWHNPKICRELIKGVRAGGFKSIRLPVSWHNHVSGEADTIDPAWMDRVEEIVKMCLEEGFYVVLNTHHDIREGFLLPDDSHIERSKAFMKNVWTQIAERFKDYDPDRLHFESMNEIRVPKASYEWTPDPENPECRAAMLNVNELNRIFLETVRASGGNNATRLLVLPGYSTSVEGCCFEGFKLPKDSVEGRLIVSAHVYSPAHFVFLVDHGEDIKTFDPSKKECTDPIDERLEKLYNRFVKNGIPVSINEFGTVDKNNLEDRVKCLAYTAAKAKSLGINCCYWDNGRFNMYGEAMAIFDRRTNTFPRKEPLEALILNTEG